MFDGIAPRCIHAAFTPHSRCIHAAFMLHDARCQGQAAVAGLWQEVGDVVVKTLIAAQPQLEHIYTQCRCHQYRGSNATTSSRGGKHRVLGM